MCLYYVCSNRCVYIVCVDSNLVVGVSKMYLYHLCSNRRVYIVCVASNLGVGVSILSV